MRSISPAGLAKLATRYGNESITIIEVDWAVGRAHSYADRDVSSIPGRIIDVGDLDNVIGVSNNNSSQSLAVTLDDTDGTIKAIFDGYDIHKRDVRVYQWFEGLALTDKFLLFAGKVSSPIVWNERDRTVKFTVISQLEDKEIGFSAEEGQFPYLPADLVGKAWPMIFGTVQDCPALQINKAVTGITLTGVGIISGQSIYLDRTATEDSNTYISTRNQLIPLAAQTSLASYAGILWEGVDNKQAEQFQEQASQGSAQFNKIVATYFKNLECAALKRANQIAEANSCGNGQNPIRILGGEDFPQGVTITLDINGGQFTGYFNGQLFYATSRYNPAGDADAAAAAKSDSEICPPDPSIPQPFRNEISVPCSWLHHDPCTVVAEGYTTPPNDDSNAIQDPILQQFWADAGARVLMHSDEILTYIVSITPGTVLAVKAMRTLSGVQRLIDVPSSLYTVVTQVYGTVTAVQIILPRPLSTLTTAEIQTTCGDTATTVTTENQGWSDDLYVTFQSSVGPDIIDILEYIIDNYTDLDYDGDSFEYCRTKLTPFPANFPLLERKNTIEVLRDIAFQSRCAILLTNGIFYLRYLPEKPTGEMLVDEITVADMDAEAGVEVSLTPTEDLVTKMIVKWRISWAPDENEYVNEADKHEKTMILRHNIERYGTQEQEYDWYIFNQPDIILKCATFWLIRLSRTWKCIAFRVFLNKLNLETFDAVTFSPTGYLASEPVTVLVSKAAYNSANNCVEMECQTPVRAGTLVEDQFFWPADLSPSVTWPPQEDIDNGNAGGGGIGAGATGELPIGDTSNIEDGNTVFVGGHNVVFRANADWGDRQPTDSGFTAQQTLSASNTNLTVGGRPRLSLKFHRMKATEKFNPLDLTGGLTIDLDSTRITDTRLELSRWGYLSSLLKMNDGGDVCIDRAVGRILTEENPDGALLSTLIYVTSDNRVALSVDAYVAGDERPMGAMFDFKYDEEGGVYGAGTAFLQD